MDRKEVEKLATLARLELSDKEADALAGEVESILGYVSEIQTVATEESKLTAGAHRNVVREDGTPHDPGIYTEAILGEAPNREGSHIKVKRILNYD